MVEALVHRPSKIAGLPSSIAHERDGAGRQFFGWAVDDLRHKCMLRSQARSEFQVRLFAVFAEVMLDNTARASGEAQRHESDRIGKHPDADRDRHREAVPVALVADEDDAVHASCDRGDDPDHDLCYPNR